MPDSYALQYDAGGKPFYQLPGKSRVYVSPVAMGGQAPADTTGMFRQGPQFDQNTGDWETPLDWGNIMSLVAAGVLTAGAANAIMAGGAAGGAVGGASAAGAGGAGAAGAGAGASTAGLSAAAGGGLTSDLLRYALPTAGSVIGGIIQTKANTKASEAEQKYLEEALAYQKEQDKLDRERQTKLDAQEQSRYGDTQGRIDARIALEGGRYGDYTNNISPYLATGASANSRMAQLLGLPTPPPFTPNAQGGGSRGPAPELDADAAAFIADWQKTHPVSEGIGPLYDALSAAGFSVARPTNASGLSNDKLAINGQMFDFATNWNATGAGSSWGQSYVEPYATPKAAPKPTPAPVATTGPVETMPGPTADPLISAAPATMGPVDTRPGLTDDLVTVQSPTGQTKRVSRADADHYVKMGAKVLNG